MAFETGMFVLALLAFLVGLPLTALHIYALIYPKSDIGKKLYPPPHFAKGSEEQCIQTPRRCLSLPLPSLA
jgi:hypothetical protein